MPLMTRRCASAWRPSGERRASSADEAGLGSDHTHPQRSRQRPFFRGDGVEASERRVDFILVLAPERACAPMRYAGLAEEHAHHAHGRAADIREPSPGSARSWQNSGKQETGRDQPSPFRAISIAHLGHDQEWCTQGLRSAPIRCGGGNQRMPKAFYPARDLIQLLKEFS